MFWNVFYRDYEFWADDNISVYYDVNNQKSKLVNLYLTSVLSKKLKGTFSYGKQFRCSKNMDLEIYLPILSNWEVAYDYMENYIKEIEAYHIKEIEAYLQSTGLSDYELSNDEKLALQNILSSNSKKFRLDELFEKLDLKFLKEDFNKEKDISKEQTKEFNIPLVNAKFWNNGIIEESKILKQLN